MAFNNINSVDISENGDDFINSDIALDEFQQNDGDVLTQASAVQLHRTRLSNISGKESEMRHICNICEKTFTLKSNLTRHMKTHTDEKPYICSICLKGFYRNIHLSQHVRVHAKAKKTYICEHCKSEFTKNSDLIKHIRVNHPKVKKTHVCEHCKSEFSKQFDLLQHMRLNHRKVKKEHNCKLCESVFTKKFDLLKHMRLNHPKVKKTHACEQCKSEFAKKSDLLKHMQVNHRKAKKEHSCKQCVSVFSKKSDLFKHVQTNHPSKGKIIKSYSLKRKTAPPLKTFKYERTALGVFSTSVFEPSEEASGDILTFFFEARPEVQYKLITQLEEKRGIKWYAVLNVVLSRISSEGDLDTITPHFRSKCIIELMENTIEEHLEQGLQKIINSFENFAQRGSGWTLEKIIHLELNCCTYDPLAARGPSIPFEESLE